MFLRGCLESSANVMKILKKYNVVQRFEHGLANLTNEKVLVFEYPNPESFEWEFLGNSSRVESSETPEIRFYTLQSFSEVSHLLTKIDEEEIVTGATLVFVVTWKWMRIIVKTYNMG